MLRSVNRQLPLSFSKTCIVTKVDMRKNPGGIFGLFIGRLESWKIEFRAIKMNVAFSQNWNCGMCTSPFYLLTCEQIATNNHVWRKQLNILLTNKSRTSLIDAEVDDDIILKLPTGTLHNTGQCSPWKGRGVSWWQSAASPLDATTFYTLDL